MSLLEMLLPALEVALVLVILFTLRELLRLRREVRLSQLSLPKPDEVRKLEKSLRDAGAQALKEARELAGKLDSIRAEVDRLAAATEREPSVEAEEIVSEVPVEEERAAVPPDGQPKPGPRVLSEAGRAKYDRVLYLATRGLDAESIAGEVDLTRAEVELMLGAAR
ncbi:MAG: hypothetical protein Q7T82_11220 [Armatimonadota bacterium]|nr:hypothetical protein [Armatimonadota bacterium]